MPSPKPLLDEPKNRKKALGLLARGETKSGVAKALGCSRATVGRWSSREEVQRWIEDGAQKYLESLPDALAISTNLLQAGKKESGMLLGKKKADVDHKVLELAVREAESMRKSVGIIPAQHQSVVIGQLILGDQTNVLAPNVQSLLDHHLNNVLDVTPEPENANPAQTETGTEEES